MAGKIDRVAVGVRRAGKTFLCNSLVTSDTERSYVRDFPGGTVRFVSLPELVRRLAAG